MAPTPASTMVLKAFWTSIERGEHHSKTFTSQFTVLEVVDGIIVVALAKMAFSLAELG
jgi:hypothetical protein